MSLKEKLLSDLKGALKARDTVRLNTIRILISEIKNQEIRQKKVIDDAAVVAIVVSQVKKRKEAAALYDKGNRPELSQKEKQEIEILQTYLPEQVPEEDLRRRIQEIIKELDAHGTGEMGRIMKTVVPEFKGKADNQLIKNLVSEYLVQKQ
ncbi:MAG: GatB/YqeY domain-containing protein [Nitrospinaceae bacterium]